MSKFPFKSDEIVMAVESFNMQITPYEDITVKRGMRLRANHIAVQRLPSYFIPDASSEEDMVARRNEILNSREIVDSRARDAAAAVAPKPPKAIAHADKMLCIKQAGAFGAKVATARADGEPLGAQPGDVVSRNHEVYKKNRDHFIPMAPQGLTEEEAMVASEDLIRHGREGAPARRVYKGQWLHRDDEMVALNPYQFDFPPRTYARTEA